MKQLTLDASENTAIEKIGRASVQIVHDIKNQLNGLKLYATFLRKRMERRANEGGETAADELETITKLIAGLDRATSDAAALVRFGRPLELRRQPATSLARILSNSAPDSFDQTANENCEGEYDAILLGEALKEITNYASRLDSTNTETDAPLRVCLTREDEQAVIEWTNLKINAADDPFHSLAGSDALRMALAARIIEAHGGTTEADANALRVRLPIKNSDE
jgi:signal transduction histidine kinase